MISARYTIKQRMPQQNVVKLPQLNSTKLLSTHSKMSDCNMQSQSQKILIQPIVFKPRDQIVPIQNIAMHDSISYMSSMFSLNNISHEVATESAPDLCDKIFKQTNLLKDNLVRVNRLMLSSTNLFNETMQIGSQQVLQLVQLKQWSQ
ncbi:Hypothetical_protein [Hexamita inflata]|uniref:Hypothetical_protein n=1 Tax=Hexamita inflata TaxID=28002 RepID=A0AA86UVM0_9EUKA|nr:Hypothetical protein HINF_LOCUS57299 [Hexamita inflata]CAI9969657.1 Hypothetical protein HINF_LOCUS57302 [Hexamita inflata]